MIRFDSSLTASSLLRHALLYPVLTAAEERSTRDRRTGREFERV